MQRGFELLDVLATVGVFATIVSGGLFLMTGNGTKELPSTAMTQLNWVTGEHLQWQNSPFGYLDSIKLSAAWREAERDKKPSGDWTATVHHSAQSPAVVGASFILMSLAGFLLVRLWQAPPMVIMKFGPPSNGPSSWRELLRCEARGVTW